MRYICFGSNIGPQISHFHLRTYFQRWAKSYHELVTTPITISIHIWLSMIATINLIIHNDFFINFAAMQSRLIAIGNVINSSLL